MDIQETKKLLKKFKEFCMERDLTLMQTARILKVSTACVADLWRSAENGKVKKHHDRTLHKIKKFMGDN